MALITDKPAGLDSGNDLDKLPDDLLGPHPAEIVFQNRILDVMDQPPEPGELVKFEFTLRTRKDGREKLDDGTYKHYRIMEFVKAVLTVGPHAPAPDPAADAPPDDDPAMIDRDGNIPDDESDDDTTTGEEADGLDEFNPTFSHNGTDD